jgi:hypothetical protein
MVAKCAGQQLVRLGCCSALAGSVPSGPAGPTAAGTDTPAGGVGPQQRGGTELASAARSPPPP